MPVHRRPRPAGSADKTGRTIVSVHVRIVDQIIHALVHHQPELAASRLIAPPPETPSVPARNSDLVAIPAAGPVSVRLLMRGEIFQPALYRLLRLRRTEILPRLDVPGRHHTLAAPLLCVRSLNRRDAENAEKEKGKPHGTYPQNYPVPLFPCSFVCFRHHSLYFPLRPLRLCGSIPSASLPTGTCSIVPRAHGIPLRRLRSGLPARHAASAD